MPASQKLTELETKHNKAKLELEEARASLQVRLYRGACLSRRIDSFS